MSEIRHRRPLAPEYTAIAPGCGSSSVIASLHHQRLASDPVAHKPLAAGDWRTVGPDDLVSVRLIYPHREGSTFSVRYNPNFRFHYLSDQTPDEVTLIKCFDSAEDGTAG